MCREIKCRMLDEFVGYEYAVFTELNTPGA